MTGVSFFEYEQAPVEQFALLAVLGLAGESEQVGKVLTPEGFEHLLVLAVDVRHRRHFFCLVRSPFKRLLSLSLFE